MTYTIVNLEQGTRAWLRWRSQGLGAGPPRSPKLLLRPRGLTCLVHFDDTTAQWLGDRYCAVTLYAPAG